MSTMLKKDMNEILNISNKIKCNLKKKSGQVNELENRENKPKLLFKNGDTTEIYDQVNNNNCITILYLHHNIICRHSAIYSGNW